MFVENKTTVLSHCQLYNNKFRGLTGEYISIIQGLNNKFNYKELIGSSEEIDFEKLGGGTP